MAAVKRRLELLKLEGLGFSQSEIVTELSQKYQCSGRTVYRDFESRGRWQPELQNVKNHTQILMRTVNRYERARDDDYVVKVAENVEEDKELIEAGFEYVTDRDCLKIYRK